MTPVFCSECYYYGEELKKFKVDSVCTFPENIKKDWFSRKKKAFLQKPAEINANNNCKRFREVTA